MKKEKTLHRLDPQEHAWLRAPGLVVVWDAIEKAGGAARVVGGAVRDALLGREVREVDLATTLPPEKTIAALSAAGVRTVPTGVDHGTILAVADGKGYEVTTLRRDVETDGRRARVRFTDDWETDASRRDFTINALFLARDGTIHDFVGGVEDIAARRLRFIGDPEARLREDVLRLLRYFRFLAQLQEAAAAWPAEAEALAACRDLAPLLPTLSAERVWRELNLLLESADPAPIVRLMHANGALTHWLDEATGFDRLARLTALDNAPRGAPLRLGALLGAGHERAARRLRLSRADSARLCGAAALAPLIQGTADPKTLRQLIYDEGAAIVRDALWLLAAEEGALRPSLMAALAAWEKPSLPITGKDILRLGLNSGPEVGAVLAGVEAWWRMGDFSHDRAACLDYAQELLVKVHRRAAGA